MSSDKRRQLRLAGKIGVGSSSSSRESTPVDPNDLPSRSTDKKSEKDAWISLASSSTTTSTHQASDQDTQEQGLIFLVSLFEQMDPQVIQETYFRLEQNVERTMDALLCQVEEEEDEEEESVLQDHSSPSLKQSPSHHLISPLQQLADVFPEFPEIELVHALDISQNNVQAAYDLLFQKHTLLQNQRREMDNRIAQLSEIFPELHVDDILAALQIYPTVQEATLYLSSCDTQQDRPRRKVKETPSVVSFGFSGSTNIPYQSNDHTPPPQTLSLVSKEPNVLQEPDFYRQRAHQVYLERRDLYLKAAHAFRQNNQTGRSVASYFSQEAHAMKSNMDKWNQLAAKAVIQRNATRYQQQGTIDLHGLTVKEAIEYLEKEIPVWYRQKSASTSVLVIIVGSGSHSAKQTSKLRPAVRRHLNHAGWTFYEEEASPGCIFVKGRI